jgi:hypothetical protein
VQSIFVSWLYSYQQARGQSSQAFRDRLDWMMENDKLYQDFLGSNEKAGNKAGSGGSSSNL